MRYILGLVLMWVSIWLNFIIFGGRLEPILETMPSALFAAIGFSAGAVIAANTGHASVLAIIRDLIFGMPAQPVTVPNWENVKAARLAGLKAAERAAVYAGFFCFLLSGAKVLGAPSAPTDHLSLMGAHGVAALAICLFFAKAVLAPAYGRLASIYGSFKAYRPSGSWQIAGAQI